MKILIYGHDPGGLSVIIPVVKRLLREKCEIIFIMSTYLDNYLNDLEQSLEIVNLNVLNKVDLQEFFEKRKFDLILTGTSSYHEGERNIWEIAKLLKIPTATVLDHWMNLSIRFARNPQNKINQSYKIDIYPDLLFCIDRVMKEELLQLGINSQIIEVGHTKLYELSNNKINCTKETKRWVYVSEPIKSIYASSVNFDEYDIIRILLESINRFNQNITFVIKPHPKQKIDMSLLNELNDTYDIKAKIEYEVIYLPSDLIIGSFTIALLEKAIQGYKVLNIVPDKSAYKYSLLAVKHALLPVSGPDDILNHFYYNDFTINQEKLFNFTYNPVDIIFKEIKKYEKISN